MLTCEKSSSETFTETLQTSFTLNKEVQKPNIHISSDQRVCVFVCVHGFVCMLMRACVCVFVYDTLLFSGMKCIRSTREVSEGATCLSCDICADFRILFNVPL